MNSPDSKTTQSLEESWDRKPAEKASFCIWWWEDIIKKSTLRVCTHGSQTAAKLNEEKENQCLDYWTYPDRKPADVPSLDKDWEKCAQLRRICRGPVLQK
jgi:hypothetical protein